MNNRILVVDGYSTARHLVDALNALSAECDHVCSAKLPPASLAKAFNGDGYNADLGYLGSCEEAALKLKSKGYVAVVPGSEPGVEYAERLALLLGLPTNRPELATARRNKMNMADAVARAGMRVARHAYVETISEAMAFVELLSAWPVVVKPVDSAGSDGVHFCYSEADIQFALANNIGKLNLLGFKNQGLMIQEFLNGRQFFFNTVSKDGKHVVIDGWERRTRDIAGYANVLEDWLLVDPTQPHVAACLSYSLRVLDALGMENGSAVTEVRLTANGPVLVETGARMNGPTMELAPYLAAGLDGTQATSWAECIVRPATFLKSHASATTYSVKHNAAISFFIFCDDAVVIDSAGLRRLNNLPSWFATTGSLAAGDRVTQTTDTMGRGGFVYWVHPVLEVIKADLDTFRRLEGEGLLYALGADIAVWERAV